MRLQQYTFDVKYKSERFHQDADCLSRHPVDPPDAADDDDAVFLCPISVLLHITEEQRRDPGFDRSSTTLTLHHLTRRRGCLCVGITFCIGEIPVLMGRNFCSLSMRICAPLSSSNFTTCLLLVTSAFPARTNAYTSLFSGPACTVSYALRQLLRPVSAPQDTNIA